MTEDFLNSIANSMTEFGTVTVDEGSGQTREVNFAELLSVKVADCVSLPYPEGKYRFIIDDIGVDVTPKKKTPFVGFKVRALAFLETDMEFPERLSVEKFERVVKFFLSSTPIRLRKFAEVVYGNPLPKDAALKDILLPLRGKTFTAFIKHEY